MLWLASTLLGGVVFGVGPATAAAHVLVRRRIRGDGAKLVRSFVREYFGHFAKGNALGVPVLLVLAVLALNWNYFSAAPDLGSQFAAIGILLAALIAVGAACHLFPMYARYELPLPKYLVMSPRFALRHLAGTAVLLFVTAAAIFACGVVPGLIPFFGIGAWLYLTGWLCDRFFTANDEEMAGKLAEGAGVADTLLPGSQ